MGFTGSRADKDRASVVSEAGTRSGEAATDPTATAGTGVVDQRARSGAVSSRLLALLQTLRPWQWTRNGLVLLALVFARRLTDLPSVERAIGAFFAFALAASAIYVVNDLADRERDRLHPRKRLRPIAAGRITPGEAWILAALCLAGSAALAYVILGAIPTGADPFAIWGGSRALFVVTLGSYVALNVLYSHWLKHVVLLDVFLIAAGYVLRALAGAFVVPVPISPWFYLCISFGALFLALGKRRAELVLLSEGAAAHRRNLQDYTLLLLDQLLVIVVTCAVISYSLYTFQGEYASHALMVTIPLMLFGVFRYLYLVYVKAAGERPDDLLWRDPQILATVVLWGMLVVFLLYALPTLRALSLLSLLSLLPGRSWVLAFHIARP